jgi:ribosomal protein L11 methyltransferase
MRRSALDSAAESPRSERIGERGPRRRRIATLETISVDVPESALEIYEAALSSACFTIGFFREHNIGTWRVEGVKSVGDSEPALVAALALAAEVSGVRTSVQRTPAAAEGWLARSYASFPEQRIGRRFSVRGTHLCGPPPTGRLGLTLDAGLAFGSGEHGSTRGCIRALERVAWRRPMRILDLGTGSGILAMAAARLLHRPVLATDIEPWSVYVARQNVLLNRLGRLVRIRLANGWRHVAVRAGGPYDLVLANILARPLSLMACQLAAHLAPGGTAILSGLLQNQLRSVLAAHLRCGLRLEATLKEGIWATLILRQSASVTSRGARNTSSVSMRCNHAHANDRRRRSGRRRAPNRPVTSRYRTVRGRSSSPSPA